MTFNKNRCFKIALIFLIAVVFLSYFMHMLYGKLSLDSNLDKARTAMLNNQNELFLELIKNNPMILSESYSDPTGWVDSHILLTEAVEYHKSDLVRSLLNSGYKPSQDVLDRCLRSSISLADVAMLTVLLDHGADANGTFLDQGTPIGMLGFAAYWDKQRTEGFPMVKLLLAKGADVNALQYGDRSLLFQQLVLIYNETNHKSLQKNYELLEVILNVPDLVVIKNHPVYGNPLSYLVEKGPVDLIRKMIEIGIPIDIGLSPNATPINILKQTMEAQAISGSEKEIERLNQMKLLFDKSTSLRTKTE